MGHKHLYFERRKLMALEKLKSWAKEKAEDVKTSVDIKLWQLGEWAKENPEQAATIICTAIGAAGIIIKRVDRGARIRKEERLKDRYIYDRSLGSYWNLRRRPTQTEKLRIERLRRQGLSYGEILTQMKLL